jgi:hypothetical protein
MNLRKLRKKRPPTSSGRYTPIVLQLVLNAYNSILKLRLSQLLLLNSLRVHLYLLREILRIICEISLAYPYLIYRVFVVAALS